MPLLADLGENKTKTIMNHCWSNSPGPLQNRFWPSIRGQAWSHTPLPVVTTMASHGFVCLFSSERSYLPVFTFVPHPNLETSSRLPSFTDTISQRPQRPPWHPGVCSLNSPPMLSPHYSTRLNWQLNVSWNIPQWSEMISCSYWFCKQAFISRRKFKKLFRCLCNFLATNEIKTCLSHTYVV